MQGTLLNADIFRLGPKEYRSSRTLVGRRWRVSNTDNSKCSLSLPLGNNFQVNKE